MDSMKLEDCCEILDSQRVPITGSDRTSGDYPYYGANGIQDYVDDLFLMMNLYCLLKMVETSDQKHDQLLIEFQENVG